MNLQAYIEIEEMRRLGEELQSKKIRMFYYIDVQYIQLRKHRLLPENLILYFECMDFKQGKVFYFVFIFYYLICPRFRL